MTIRYHKLKQKPKPKPDHHHASITRAKAQNRTNPRQSPSRNQKRHQRIPSQPIQLSNSKSVAPNTSQLKRHRLRCLTSQTPNAWSGFYSPPPQLSTQRHGLMRAVFVRNRGPYSQSTRRKAFSSSAGRPCIRGMTGCLCYQDKRHGAYAASAKCPPITRPASDAVTGTLSPSFTVPSRMSPASGFCRLRWMTRFNGRAP